MAVALDNALLTQAHFALSESLLLSFCLLSILLFVHLYSGPVKPGRALWLVWLLWGAATAAAALVKVTGAFVGVLTLLYAVKLLSEGQKRKLPAFVFLFSVAFLATTVAVWQVHFSLVPKLDPNNDYGISPAQRQMLDGVSRIDPLTRFVVQLRDAITYIRDYPRGVPRLDPAKPDEIGSPWYQWPFGGRAISYRWETLDGKTYRYIYLVGNLMTWLISLIGAILGTAVTLSDALFRYLPAARRRWIYVFTLLYWAYMIPMMFIQRVMYLYHYLPALLVGILLFGILLGEVQRLTWRTKRLILLVVLIGAIMAFWAYKPFTFYEPLTAAQFQQRNIWAPLELHCVNCGT